MTRTLFLFASLLAVRCSAAVPVWIDTDPSVERGGHEVDDGFALVQAFRSPELTVRGVSVVFGNAPLTVAWPIGQRLVRDFGPVNLQAFRGAGSAAELGQETDASRAMEQALRKERMAILAIGPATNVATVLKNHPELTHQVVQVVAVAGRRPHQQFKASARARAFRDFNFEMDPEAFQIILDSGVPLVLTPWEISSTVWLHANDLQEMHRSDPSLAWVLDAGFDWLALWKRSFGVDGFNPFDTLAVGYAVNPSRFTCQTLPVSIKVLPDDTAPQRTKPYLLASKALNSRHSALYCYQAPKGFASQLVDLLAQPAAAVDPSRWDAILRRYVTSESRVDYGALKHSGTADLDRYIREIAAPWPANLTQSATKAALINAYNALTVQWIAANYPTPSIWSTNHPFQTPRNEVNNQKVSLDEIEGQLRAMHDPRIHAALVCAARSCPPLRQEAYTPDRIDEQLDDNVRRWLADPNLNQFNPARQVAEVSQIFNWYGGDFQSVGGVREFLSKFAPLEDRKFLTNPASTIEYKPYNWGLNGTGDLGAHYSQLNFYWDWARNGYLYQSARRRGSGSER